MSEAVAKFILYKKGIDPESFLELSSHMMDMSYTITFNRIPMPAMFAGQVRQLRLLMRDEFRAAVIRAAVPDLAKIIDEMMNSAQHYGSGQERLRISESIWNSAMKEFHTLKQAPLLVTSPQDKKPWTTI